MKIKIVTFSIALAFIIGSILFIQYRKKEEIQFDGARALKDIYYQVELGPRIPGSTAHAEVVDWILDELEAAGWRSEVQRTEVLGHPIDNVIGKWGSDRPWVVIGAHYDSRLQADNDPNPENHVLPVPGANDGASGVAILLELARKLPLSSQQFQAGQGRAKQVWLVFFDAEDNGNIPGWDWILGSRGFVISLTDNPDAVIIVDMVGDADLKIYQEKNSEPYLVEEIWASAAALGYQRFFIPKYKYSILDDHIPFRERNIPAVVIIDFDYAYWHTLQDTPDKISAKSLQVVGETLLHWLTK